MTDKCTECGGRLVYHIGDHKVLAVDCLSGCSIPENKRMELIQSYASSMYQCPDCGWIGTEDEMGADYQITEGGDDMWSNCICPKCKRWYQLQDYEKVMVK